MIAHAKKTKNLYIKMTKISITCIKLIFLSFFLINDIRQNIINTNFILFLLFLLNLHNYTIFY